MISNAPSLVGTTLADQPLFTVMFGPPSQFICASQSIQPRDDNIIWVCCGEYRAMIRSSYVDGEHDVHPARRLLCCHFHGAPIITKQVYQDVISCCIISEVQLYKCSAYRVHIARMNSKGNHQVTDHRRPLQQLRHDYIRYDMWLHPRQTALLHFACLYRNIYLKKEDICHMDHITTGR
jgi:hypothetical protein